MSILKNIDIKTSTLVKLGAIALLLIIVIAFAFRIIGSSVTTLTRGVSTQSAPARMYASDGGFDYDMAESSAYGKELSVRNVMGSNILPPQPGYSSGNTAEAFEITEYYGDIETRHKEDTCTLVADLKQKEYIIFENANEYDRGCSYSFKVENDNVQEVLTLINSLDPENLSANTYTIKQTVDDFTSEVEVLEKKRASIDETLENALAAYDEVTELATQTQNVESLAKIIDSRINLIERLTQERININERLERLERAQAEQLDRLEYTFFHINIYENKYIDGEQIQDSWKVAVQQFVRDINDIAQDVTIHLVQIVLRVAQFVLYAFILLFVAKYGWRAAKHVWNK